MIDCTSRLPDGAKPVDLEVESDDVILRELSNPELVGRMVELVTGRQCKLVYGDEPVNTAASFALVRNDTVVLVGIVDSSEISICPTADNVKTHLRSAAWTEAKHTRMISAPRRTDSQGIIDKCREMGITYQPDAYRVHYAFAALAHLSCTTFQDVKTAMSDLRCKLGRMENDGTVIEYLTLRHHTTRLRREVGGTISTVIRANRPAFTSSSASCTPLTEDERKIASAILMLRRGKIVHSSRSVDFKLKDSSEPCPIIMPQGVAKSWQRVEVQTPLPKFVRGSLVTYTVGRSVDDALASGVTFTTPAQALATFEKSNGVLIVVRVHDTFMRDESGRVRAAHPFLALPEWAIVFEQRGKK